MNDVFTVRQGPGDDDGEDRAGLAMLVGAGHCSGNTRDEIFTDRTGLACPGWLYSKLETGDHNINILIWSVRAFMHLQDILIFL